MDALKTKILATLRAFIAQRPGMDPRNYDAAGYRRESREVTRDRHHAEELIRAVELSSVSGADILRVCGTGGRLTITDVSDHNTLKGEVSYTTGQYFATEYRKAVARLMASVLWDYVRETSMPAPEYVQHGSATDLPMRTESVYRWHGKSGGSVRLSGGDWLRAYFRRQFGRVIADRYFN